MSEIKVLELTLKKKWFDMIVSGEKKEEYREGKQYWIARLCKKVEDESHAVFVIRKFSHVRFRYSKKSPTHIRKVKDIIIGAGKKEWGADESENYFVIKLGEPCDELEIK